MDARDPRSSRWIDTASQEGALVSADAAGRPALRCGPEKGRTFARTVVNDFGGKMTHDYPKRCDSLQASPALPQVDASLKEIEYAFDTLHVDGVGVYTSIGDTYLGDPVARAEIFEELNRRKAGHLSSGLGPARKRRWPQSGGGQRRFPRPSSTSI